jgi:hypothetical protein
MPLKPISRPNPILDNHPSKELAFQKHTLLTNQHWHVRGGDGHKLHRICHLGHKYEISFTSRSIEIMYPTMNKLLDSEKNNDNS